MADGHVPLLSATRLQVNHHECQSSNYICFASLREKTRTFNASKLLTQCDEISPLHMASPYKSQDLFSGERGQAI